MTNSKADPELEAWNQHLNRRGVPTPVCRWCGENDWAFRGVSGLLAFGESGELGPGAMPVATIVCLNCYLVETFSWMPIEREHLLVVPQ